MFGENTEEGRNKFKSELEDLHIIFKVIHARRCLPNVEQVVLLTISLIVERADLVIKIELYNFNLIVVLNAILRAHNIPHQS